METSPIAARAGSVPIVIGSGKMGVAYEMNARTGRLIWKTPVGAHNGHDDDSIRALEGRRTLKAPLTILPGTFGGALTDLAVAQNSAYVATIDLPLTFTSLGNPTPTKAAASTNSPIAIAGNTLIVPAGAPTTRTGGGRPQVVAYTVP
jgi:hypothetical protein